MTDRRPITIHTPLLTNKTVSGTIPQQKQGA